MTDMLDIARSGLFAYRSALAVTAENIANVGTDGYRRRDLVTASAPGARATPVTQATGGQGTQVTEVRRAFDALAADRLRGAAGMRAAAAAQLAGTEAVEALVLPGENGIDQRLRDVFDAFDALAVDPTRGSARAAAAGAGQALASALSDLGRGMASLRDDLAARAAATAASAQDILESLAEIGRRLGGLSPAAPAEGAAHPLADRRDALLDDLAELVPVSVSYAAGGRPTVRYGGPAGPVLLQGDAAAQLSVAAGDLLTLTVVPPGAAATDTRTIARGTLAGLSRALGALDMAVQELDGFARRMAGAMNALHRDGIDATGAAGGDLFGMAGWTATAAATVTGTVAVDVIPTDDVPGAPMSLTYDGGAGEWVARDGGGAEIARGTGRLVLPGVTVDLAGAPRDGDRIDLAPVSGRARDLRWMPDSADRLAAAAAFVVTPGAANGGGASLSAEPAPALPGAWDVDIVDAAAGAVTLRDRATGAVIASGVLDAGGRVTLAGIALQLTGGAADGDRFAIIPAGAGSADATVARALAALRAADPATGAPGLADRLARLQADAGIRVAAASRSLATAEAGEEAAGRALAAIGAVDLDTEAARLVELQQGYQASAQAMTVARDLFDTLLGMF